MIDQFILGEEEVSNWIKKSKTIQSVSRIPGDASTRKYYRIVSKSNSYIVMRMEPFPEEGKNLPFLSVQRHLAEAGVEVPNVLDVDAKRGFILLEDLGDITLLRRLQEVSNPNEERKIYERVIDALVHLQVHASPKGGKKKAKSKSIDGFNLRFDTEKLMWEVNFTFENFYQLYLKRNIKGKDRKVLLDGFTGICQFLAAQPTVLAHRDFHSRNIMVTPQSGGTDRLVMIDFQDARMGPAQYDLASLLKDSYYQMEEAQISLLLNYYMSRFEDLAEVAIDRALFARVFDVMSVQRNFKAIGSFSSFMNKRGDPSYLKYIGNTFENIRKILLKYPEYSRLREILFHYYYF